MDKIKFIVIVKRDTDDPEVFPFEDGSEEIAWKLYDRLKITWTEVYFCDVRMGPDESLSSGESTI